MVDPESPPAPPQQISPTSGKTGKTKIVPNEKLQENCEAWSENESEKKNTEESNENGNENEPFIKEKQKNNVKIFAIKVATEKTGSSQLKRQQQTKKKSARLKILQICKCCPWYVPWVSLIISSIQICIYLLNSDTIYQTLIFSPQKTNEVWRFVTYTFLHAGTVHLTLNIIIQIMVAFPLETEQGHLRVLLVYFIGILSGALGASVFEPTLMIGASAGVYCLLMSHIPHIVMNFSSLSNRYFRIVAVFVLCISDVFYSIHHCLTKGNSQPRIGVAAHVSGAVSGVLIGFIVYRGSKLIYYRVFKYLSLFIYLGCFITTIIYNVDRKFLDFLKDF